MNPDDIDLEPDAFASYLRRVKLFAVVAGVIGGALGFCFSVLALVKLDHPDIGGVVAAPVMCGLIFGALVAGCALLFAPMSFFNSEKGKACLKTIGTRDVVVARAFIFVCLLLGCGVITLGVSGALQMTGVIDQPMRR